MSGISDLAMATVQETGAVAPVSMRLMVVTAVNAGPPKSLDLALVSGGATVIQKARYLASYHVLVPAVNDVVLVLITQAGGSMHRGRTRGGTAMVIDKVAV